MRKVAFFGDSITQGAFETGAPFDVDHVYHRQLYTMLNHPQLVFINKGVCGDSCAAGLARLERDVLPCEPDVVVVCFGLNDAPRGPEGLRGYKSALDAIFEKLAGIPTAFMTPNMFNTYVHERTAPDDLAFAAKTAEMQRNGTMDQYMAAAVQTAADHGVHLCDCYSE